MVKALPASDQNFSIEEESSAGGSSHCWTEKKKKGYYLYGNELGKMAGPEPTVYDAVVGGGFEFCMNHAKIECNISTDELGRILRAMCVLDNFDTLSINGLDIEARDVEGIIAEFVSRLDGDYGWTDRPG